MSFVHQKDEDYCDDINFLGESFSDMVVIDEIFRHFEDISGAILSRSNKSKIMGLGPWKNKLVWPMQWLKVVKLIKIFGFQVTPVYKETLDLSWDSCFSSFVQTIMSWKSRQLNTIFQRVQVIKVFATSKLWYKASALPLPSKFAKKIESVIGRFLWVGKLERLQIDELKNSEEAGGLGLPCVSSKANSLFLKQKCRIFMSSDSKQYAHVKFWLGLYVGDFFHEMSLGPHAEIISPYFNYMRL